MAEKRLYKIVAAFAAIFIYLFFVYMLVDFVKSNKQFIQDFGYNVDDAIVVELSAPVNDKPVHKPVDKPKPTPVPIPQPKHIVQPIIFPPDPEVLPEPIKEITPTQEVKEVIKEIEKEEKKLVQEEEESRDLIAKSAKDLFSTIRTEKYDKVLDERQKQDEARASRLKKQKAKQARKKEESKRRREKKAKALAAAKAAMRDIEQASAASHKKSGVEDAFWSPVSSRIQALWNRTIQTQDGLNADVQITIDSKGRLRYRIKRLSNNQQFDQKLHIFLQNLEYENFPKYRGGGSTSRIILFEDQESL